MLDLSCCLCHMDVSVVSGENKGVIMKKLTKSNLLEKLESWWHNIAYIKREVGFCALWCLDNFCEFVSVFVVLSTMYHVSTQLPSIK